MSLLWTSHVAHINAQCHTYEWVTSHIQKSHIMSHIWMVHVAHTKEPPMWTRSVPHSFVCAAWLIHMCDIMWLFCMCDVTHSYVWHAPICTRNATNMNESCHTHEQAMSHIWMSHVAHTKASLNVTLFTQCHTYEWFTLHIQKSHPCERVVPHSFVCAAWLIHMCDITRLFCMCDVTHSHVWHCVTLLYVQRDSFIQKSVAHYAFTWATLLYVRESHTMSHIWMVYAAHTQKRKSHIMMKRERVT